MGLTLLLSLGGLVLSWVIAFPIGVHSALRRHSLGDYAFTLFAMLGIAIPQFLLSLAAMYCAFRFFDVDLGVLHSERYIDAAPSLGKGLDFATRLFVPAFILALPNAGRLMRILRANLLDELGKPYVVTARAKGMRELRLLLKYPMRVALNPFVSTIGMTLPQLVSGGVIISLVLSLPTVGPLLLRALQAQDMFLASAILLVLATLTVLGSLLSDLVLAWLDPRIRQAG
jgi:peptide/nickel transport system permease protein